MKTEKKMTLSERMAARQSEARAKIKDALWEDNPDADAVAAVALAGAIPPAEVDKMAAEIESAKATLQKAVEADKELPELREKLTAAKAEAEKAEAALAAADAADDAARCELGEAGEAVDRATRERDAAALLLRDGALPPALAPAFAREKAEKDEAEHKRTEAAGRLGVLKNQIRWREDRVDGLRRELANQKADDPKKTMRAATGGTLAAMQDVLAGRLKIEEDALKEAKAELKTLQKIVDAAA